MTSKWALHSIVCAAALAAGPQAACADTVSVTVAQPVAKVADARRAHILVTSGPRPIGVSPAVVSPTEDQQQALVVASMPGIERSMGALAVLAVVEGSDGAVQSSWRTLESLDSEPVFRMDRDALQQRISEQRGALRRVSDSAEREEKSLKKISEQAQEFLKFESVIGGQDSGLNTAAESARISELQALAKQRLEAIRQQPPPPAFKKRETELVEQLNSMSTALHARDQALREGLIGASPELQQKLGLIKATQGEHIDLLRRELAELRREREAAEAASAREPQPPQ